MFFQKWQWSTAWLQIKERKKPRIIIFDDPGMLLQLIHRVGHQGDGTGALDGLAQLTLMLGAIAAHPAGQDLAAFVGEAAQAIDILVIDVFDLIYAEAEIGRAHV